MYCLFIFKNSANIFLKCLPSKIELFGEKKKKGGGGEYVLEWISKGYFFKDYVQTLFVQLLNLWKLKSLTF